jgi:predicted CXXCH cytochrome family protein
LKSRLAAVLLLGLAPAQESPNVIYAPVPDSAHASGAVRVVAKSDGQTELRLDGVKVEPQSPLKGVLRADLKPSPGVHELTLGTQKLRFFSGPAAPPEFRAFREHPPVANCETCHAIKNAEWRFQRITLTGVCSQCHDREAFPKKHTHEMAILPDCQLCHAPHGSTAVAHLKLEKEKACKLCHSLQ